MTPPLETLVAARWPTSPEQAREWLETLKGKRRRTVSIERVEDLVAALEARAALSDCCGEVAWPVDGGSYVCGLKDGHTGDHASIWMQDSAANVVRWSGSKIRFDGEAVS